MGNKREREIKILLYEKGKLIKETKKEVKALRLELNEIQRGDKNNRNRSVK